MHSQNLNEISAARARENNRFYDRQSLTFFNLDIYSVLSWGARALRAHYIVIESVSFKPIVGSLDAFYGVNGKHVYPGWARRLQELYSSCFSIDIDYQDYYPIAWAWKKIRYITCCSAIYCRTFDYIQSQIESVSDSTKLPKYRIAINLRQFVLR